MVKARPVTPLAAWSNRYPGWEPLLSNRHPGQVWPGKLVTSL